MGCNTSRATEEQPVAKAVSPSNAAFDEKAVRADLAAIMDKPGYDDGSIGPILIRLAWHSSGTYDASSGKYGSNGATMRFQTEAKDPENNGLHKAREFLETVKQKHPGISYSDLWILASYVALEVTGGPKIEFRPGRKDAPDESACPANGNLPRAEIEPIEPPLETDTDEELARKEKPTIDAMRKVFTRMGFNDRELVALISGGHVYGRCHTEDSGYAGPWVEEPTKFSNEYAADLIEDEWAPVTSDSKDCPADMRPAPGKRQYVNDGGKGTQMMLISDMALKWDPVWRAVVEEYAKDEELLKREFGQAFKKLTELGL